MRLKGTEGKERRQTDRRKMAQGAGQVARTRVATRGLALGSDCCWVPSVTTSWSLCLLVAEQCRLREMPDGVGFRVWEVMEIIIRQTKNSTREERAFSCLTTTKHCGQTSHHQPLTADISY